MKATPTYTVVSTTCTLVMMHPLANLTKFDHHAFFSYMESHQGCISASTNQGYEGADSGSSGDLLFVIHIARNVFYMPEPSNFMCVLSRTYTCIIPIQIYSHRPKTFAKYSDAS